MSVTWDELEKMGAKAMLRERGLDHCVDATMEDGADAWAIGYEALVSTRAALSAIREAGVRFMPAEATEEMLDVMHDRVRILVVPRERRADIQNDAEVYTAMRDAGEIKPENGE